MTYYTLAVSGDWVAVSRNTALATYAAGGVVVEHDGRQYKRLRRGVLPTTHDTLEGATT